jgi:hypothetical protein
VISSASILRWPGRSDSATQHPRYHDMFLTHSSPEYWNTVSCCSKCMNGNRRRRSRQYLMIELDLLCGPKRGVLEELYPTSTLWNSERYSNAPDLRVLIGTLECPDEVLRKNQLIDETPDSDIKAHERQCRRCLYPLLPHLLAVCLSRFELNVSRYELYNNLCAPPIYGTHFDPKLFEC